MLLEKQENYRTEQRPTSRGLPSRSVAEPVFLVLRWLESGQSLLYPGGGVGVRQGVVVAGGGESIEGMERLHAGDGTGDHGDGVRCHQRHVVGGTAQRQRVVRWAGGS